MQVVVVKAPSAPRQSVAKKASNKKKKQTKRPPMRTMGPSPHQVCSITDPFCVASNGMRFPDASTSPSFTARLDQILTLSTNAAGTCAFTIVPDIDFSVLYTNVAGTVATSFSTFGSPNADWSTFVTTYVNEYRPVSFGVEILPIANMMTNQGLMISQEFIGSAVVNGTFQTPNTQGPTNKVTALQGGPVSFVSRPTEPVNDYQPLRANSAPTAGTWTGLRVMITGAPVSTAVISVRIVGNYECTFFNKNYLPFSAKPPVNNPRLLAAATAVREALGPVVEGGTKAVESAFMRAAGNVLRAGARAVGGYLMGGAPGAAGAMIMDVD